MDLITRTFKKYQTQHHRQNEHHFEYFKLTEKARMHLTCHLLGIVLSRARESQMDLTLSEMRAYIEHHQWKDWKYAVTENLPLPHAVVPTIPLPPRKKFKMSQFHRLRNAEEFNMMELEVVQHHIQKLWNQINAVREVHRRIVKEHDERFEKINERIQKYNLDMFRHDMMRAYILYNYIDDFEVEAYDEDQLYDYTSPAYLDAVHQLVYLQIRGETEEKLVGQHAEEEPAVEEKVEEKNLNGVES